MLGRDPEPVTDDDIHRFVHHLAEIHLIDGKVFIMSQHVGDLEFKVLEPGKIPFPGKQQQGFGHCMGIAVEVAEHIFSQKLQVFGPQRAHHPEVDERDHIPVQDEKIARMGIGMEKAMGEDLVKDQSHRLAGQDYQGSFPDVSSVSRSLTLMPLMNSSTRICRVVYSV